MGASRKDYQGERHQSSRYSSPHRFALALLGLGLVIGVALGVKG
jgi:hypothetical protein